MRLLDLQSPSPHHHHLHHHPVAVRAAGIIINSRQHWSDGEEAEKWKDSCSRPAPSQPESGKNLNQNLTVFRRAAKWEL
jgi:hypothetical protein